jgi:hypothetical protein
MTERTGGCLCGHIRYRITSQSLMDTVCYCSNCRLQAGSAMSINLAVMEEHYQQSGETKVYQDRGDSGKAVYRHFCPDCGSPITSRAVLLPGLVIVKAGTLDDPSGFRPTAEVYTVNRPAWLPAFEGTQCSLRMPLTG